MFANKFYTLLEEDIMGMDIKTPNPHHRVAIRGLTRKSQKQIPDIHKAESHPTERKIIIVKNNGGSQPCNNNDLQYIITKYNLSNINKPRGLGKTGVTLMQSQPGNFILTR